MLVLLVAVPNADNTGLDLDRIGTVEDIPDELARTMLDLGTARKPTEEELATYEVGRSRYARGGEVATANSGSDAAPSSDTQSAPAVESPGDTATAPSKK